MFLDICPFYLDGLSKREAAMFLQGDDLLDFLVTKIVEQHGLYPKRAGTKRKRPGKTLNTDIGYSRLTKELGFDAGLNNEFLCELVDAEPRT
jgi:hypothetical protein